MGLTTIFELFSSTLSLSSLGIWRQRPRLIAAAAVVPLRDHSVMHADGVVRVLLLP